MNVAFVAERLIVEEATRSRVKRPEARAIIAREAGVSPGSLENLERGRLKFVDRIAGPLNALLVRKIERKIAELESELIVLRATAGDLDGPDVLGAEAAIEAARRCLGRA